MPRAKKGQQKVPTLKKTTRLCPSRSYYYRVISSLRPYRFNLAAAGQV